MPDTDKLFWPMPTVGGSAGTWGTELNDLIDNFIEEAQVTTAATANAALPKAGGVMTGEVELHAVRQVVVDLGTPGAGPLVIGAASGDFFHIAPTGNQSPISFTGFTSGKVKFIAIEVTNGGTKMVWPASVKWDGGSTPSLKVTGVDVLVLYSRDGGTTIRGVHSYSI